MEKDKTLEFPYTVRGVEAVQILTNFIITNHYGFEVEITQNKIYVTIDKGDYEDIKEHFGKVTKMVLENMELDT